MYWSDFRRLIERNKSAWSTVKYYRSDSGFENTISICDFSLPRRQGITHSKLLIGEDNWYQHSFVCNAAYFDGWIPFRNKMYHWNEEEKKWIAKPARGVKGTIEQLLGSGTIKRSDEIKEILNAR